MWPLWAGRPGSVLRPAVPRNRLPGLGRGLCEFQEARLRLRRIKRSLGSSAQPQGTCWSRSPRKLSAESANLGLEPSTRARTGPSRRRFGQYLQIERSGRGWKNGEAEQAPFRAPKPSKLQISQYSFGLRAGTEAHHVGLHLPQRPGLSNRPLPQTLPQTSKRKV